MKTDKCVIVPDVHQNISWVDRVLAQEKDFDRVVFLGDYFDTRTSAKLRTGVGATCSYLNKLHVDLADRAVFLLGNHDIQYLEAKPTCDLHRTPRFLNYACGSAYSQVAAAKIARDLAPEFWERSRLFVEINGWLLSHAGLTSRLWPKETNVAAGLSALETEARKALGTMKHGPHPLLQAGVVRGGDAPFGGITWLDWDEEFDDSLPLPQIVGHTASDRGARKSGRSWCLDGKQTCYGVLMGKELSVRVA